MQETYIEGWQEVLILKLTRRKIIEFQKSIKTVEFWILSLVRRERL